MKPPIFYLIINIVFFLCFSNIAFAEPAIYTQEQLDHAISEERKKYDPDGDGKIGLDNIIYYLQVLSGRREALECDANHLYLCDPSNCASAGGYWYNNTCNRTRTYAPQWLEAIINDFLSQPPTNPPITITSWEYNNETVYYIPPYCCDVMSVLYDQRGNVICHPGGGLTGSGDGKCPDFLSSKTNGTTIWQDIRPPNY